MLVTIEKIEWHDELLAMVVRCGHGEPGVNFITPPENSIQLGILKHAQGSVIKAHIHKQRTRVIQNLHEVLFLQKGKLAATFYDAAGKQVGATVLNAGDVILLLGGGHGFKVLEDASIFEVKQGPFAGTAEDKQILNVDDQGKMP